MMGTCPEKDARYLESTPRITVAVHSVRSRLDEACHCFKANENRTQDLY